MSHRARRISLIALMGVLLASAAILPASAFGALGDQLDVVVPGLDEGRGIAITGSTATVSTAKSTTLTEIDLATHQQVGELNTQGGTTGFGGLAFDRQGALWASEYEYEALSGKDQIDLIPASGAVQHVFDATVISNDSANQNIDGLAIGPDGTMWFKGEGEHGGSTTLYHVNVNFTTEEVEELGKLTLPFGVSGIAVDGEGHLWVAEIATETDAWGRQIREYDTAGNQLGSFTTPLINEVEEPHPEGLALDHCTFAGKLALWAVTANGVGTQLVAYEIAPYTGSTSDCPVPPKKEEPAKKEESKPTSTSTSTSSTSKSTATPGSSPAPVPSSNGLASVGTGGGTSGGGSYAGGSLLLHAADPADPSGLLFVYLWEFGDGSHTTGHGSVAHVYRCAGLYHLTVTDIDAKGAHHTASDELAVGFPHGDNKTYAGLHFSPHVRVSGHKATLWLSWSGKGRHVTPRSIDWKLDNQRGKRFGTRTHAVGKVALGRNHFITATARFSNGHSTTIKACFYA